MEIYGHTVVPNPDCTECGGSGWVPVETGVEYGGIKETMDEPCSCIEDQLPKGNTDDLFK